VHHPRTHRFCSFLARPARPTRRDAGQATPFVAVIIVCIAIASLAIAQLGTAAIERTRARTAADAAALAAAIDGDAAGQRLARANGATSATIGTRTRSRRQEHRCTNGASPSTSPPRSFRICSRSPPRSACANHFRRATRFTSFSAVEPTTRDAPATRAPASPWLPIAAEHMLRPSSPTLRFRVRGRALSDDC